jgi:hypothetical protein
VRYLGLALFAEGSTDHRFLSPILLRSTEEICMREVRETVQVGDVLPLTSPPEYQDAERALRIFETARSASGGFHILFIHADANGNATRARHERVDPAAARIALELPQHATVAVVPVRMTEAWALVDGDALRDAFSATARNEVLGVPARPRGVERLQDPKRALQDAYRACVSGRRGRSQTAAGFLDAIARRVSLDRLRGVPAFQQFETDLCSALVALGFVR